MQEIAQALRAILRSAEPAAVERVRPGWRLIGYDLPLGRRLVYFAYVSPEAEHVHLGFPRGALMDDPEAALLGAGVTRLARWVTIRRLDEVDRRLLAGLVHEAARLAGMAPAERSARELDRAIADRAIADRAITDRAITDR